MALIRVALPPPVKPSRDRLLWLMRTYDLKRNVVARLMRCSRPSLDRYLLPDGAAGSRPIPLIRWELLLLKRAVYSNLDEEMQFPL